MERFGKRNDAGTSVVERSQFQGILVGFCAGVNQEKLVIVVAADGSQTVGYFLLQFVDDRIGIESQCGYLFADGFHVVGMCVADGDYGMASVEVEVFLAFVVPYVTAFSLDDVDIEEGIYVE